MRYFVKSTNFRLRLGPFENVLGMADANVCYSVIESHVNVDIDRMEYVHSQYNVNIN